MNSYTREKNASSRFRPSGIYYGVVARVDGHKVWVKIPRIDPNAEFGPSGTTQAVAVGQTVACIFVEDRTDEIAILGSFGPAAATTITGDLTVTGNVIGNGSGLTNLDASALTSGTVPAARMPAHTGDATSPAGSTALTLATVNANTGTFGSGSAVPVVTVDAKGRITGISTASITGLGTLTSLTVSGALSAGSISTSGTLAAGATTITGALSATSFSGNGASITSLDASNLASGTVPSARMSGSYTGITGVGTLASLNVTGAIASGTSLTVTSSVDANIFTSGSMAGFRFADRSNNANSTVLYRSGNTNYFYSTTSGTNLMGVSDAGVIGCFGATVNNNNLVFNTSNGINWSAYGGNIWMQDTSWIRTNMGFYNGGNTIANDGFLSIGFGGATDNTWKCRVNTNFLANGTVYAGTGLTTPASISATGNGTSGSGQIMAQRNGGALGPGASTANYYDATFYANPGGVGGETQVGKTASIAFHPGGTAPQIRSGYNLTSLFVRDTGGVGSWPIEASAFNVASTRRIKKNITTWPSPNAGAASETASAVLGRLRVVTFDRDVPSNNWQLPSGRRLAAYERLTRYTTRNDLPSYELPAHDCAKHDCDGSADDPCARTLNAGRKEYGFVAEEVAEVLPEAVVYGPDRLPASINYSMIDAVLVAAVQELTERVGEFERAIEPRP